jgi:uncharacterized protein
MAYRLSRYVYRKDLAPGVVGGYSPFGQQVAFFDAGLWRDLASGVLSALPEALLDDLARRAFLVQDGFENRILQAYPQPPVKLQELWLIVTQACNMACRYCVVEGNILHHTVVNEGARPLGGMMGREVVDGALRLYFEHRPDVEDAIPRVVLYGGEPLLNRQILGYAVSRIREAEKRRFPRRRPIQILVITNGTIYDPSLTSLFKEQRVSVSVSLDGMKHHQDAVRRMAGGEETFEKVCSSLRRYTEAGLNTGICTTIGSHNVNDLPAIADFFSINFGVPVQFQVPYDLPLAGGNPFYVSMQDAAQATLEAFDRFRRRGMVEGLTMRRVSIFENGAFHHADCRAVSGQIVVSPDGKIGPCHSLAGNPLYFTGNVRDSNCTAFGQALFHEWWHRMPINMQECHGCPAIALCGGGCPYNALVREGSIWRKDPQQCEYMKILIDWLLLESWQNHRRRFSG